MRAYLAQTMKGLGYRTFGIGKFHTDPGTRSWATTSICTARSCTARPTSAARDAFAAWIAREHPAFDFIEALMGERTEMYYMPQMSPMPAEFTVEGWAADRPWSKSAGATRARFSASFRSSGRIRRWRRRPLQPHVRSRPDAQSGRATRQRIIWTSRFPG